MEPGKLRHRVTLQYPTGERDDSGQVLEAPWIDHGERWAQVQPLSGRELTQAQAINPLVSHKLTLRARGLETLTEGWRAVFEGRVLNIAYYLRPNEVPDFIDCYCIEPRG